MYHFEKKILKNLEIFERKKWVFFLKKVTRKSNAPSSKNFFFKKWLKGSIPLVQRLFFFFFENFSLFFGKDLGILNFFKKKYIHEQSTSNGTWLFRIQRNTEIWNKQINFKFNHDVANRMLSEAKLGCLLLLGPLRMLKTWYA